MDAVGVRRMRGGDVQEAVTWTSLCAVEVVTTSRGPARDDVFFVLHGADGTGVVVASEHAPDGLVERLQDLPGFDNGQLISAMSSAVDARFPCWSLTPGDEAPRVVTADREIAAPAMRIFELIADPSNQPRWDGNDNLSQAAPGQRVHAVGDVFEMTNTSGRVRENHVVEFEEGRLIAWRPAEPGKRPPGHLWRWELEPLDAGPTRVTHTYDWTDLTDTNRLPRAKATTPDKLRASIDRLAALVETMR